MLSGLRHWETKAREFKQHMEGLQKRAFEYEVILRDTKKSQRQMRKELEQANRQRF